MHPPYQLVQIIRRQLGNKGRYKKANTTENEGRWSCLEPRRKKGAVLVPKEVHLTKVFLVEISCNQQSSTDCYKFHYCSNGKYPSIPYLIINILLKSRLHKNLFRKKLPLFASLLAATDRIPSNIWPVGLINENN